MPCHNGVCKTIFVRVFGFHTHHKLHPVIRHTPPCGLHPACTFQYPPECRYTAMGVVHIEHGIPTPLLQVFFGMAPLAASGNHHGRQTSFKLSGLCYLPRSHQELILFSLRFPTLATYVSHELLQSHLDGMFIEHREVERA